MTAPHSGAVVRLGSTPATAADLVAVARGARVELAPDAQASVAASRAVVERILERGDAVYGLTTELGGGRDTAVDRDRLAAFQVRTIANSRGGFGPALPADVVRGAVFARLAGFVRGGAGVTPALADRYRALLDLDPRLVPRASAAGSVGAADLAQLAAIAAAATGDGAFVDAAGARHPAVDVLAGAGLAPLALEPGEALAALSSNAVSVASGALVAARAAELLESADLVLAVSLLAAGGNPSPFDERVQAAHPVPAQAASAARVRAHLGDAGARLAAGASRQDAIAFRSAPQVHAALAAAVARVTAAVEVELASRTENPLVDVESGELVSGGNFLVLELALALDGLRLALAHAGAIAERRTSALSNRAADERRAGRTELPGLTWYAAADRLAELRHLAGPVSLAGSPLSEGVEDHQTNAPLAARLADRALDALADVLAVELLHGAEALRLGIRGASADGAGPAVQPLLSALPTGGDADQLVTAARAALTPTQDAG